MKPITPIDCRAILDFAPGISSATSLKMLRSTPAASISLTRYRPAQGPGSRVDHFDERWPSREASAVLVGVHAVDMDVQLVLRAPSLRIDRHANIFQPSGRARSPRRDFSRSRQAPEVRIWSQELQGSRYRRFSRSGQPEFESCRRGADHDKSGPNIHLETGRGKPRVCCIGRHKSFTTYQSAVRSLTSKRRREASCRDHAAKKKSEAGCRCEQVETHASVQSFAVRWKSAFVKRSQWCRPATAVALKEQRSFLYRLRA